MEKNDRKKFLTLMAKARVTLPGPNLTDEEKALRMEVFWETLKGYGIDAIEAAFQRAVANLKYFPTPSEIIGFIFEGREESQHILLEWEGPSEEAQNKAKEMLAKLNERWKREDEEREKKRAEEFEENRKRLQLQARLILKNDRRG